MDAHRAAARTLCDASLVELLRRVDVIESILRTDPTFQASSGFDPAVVSLLGGQHETAPAAPTVASPSQLPTPSSKRARLAGGASASGSGGAGGAATTPTTSPIPLTTLLSGHVSLARVERWLDERVTLESVAQGKLNNLVSNLLVYVLEELDVGVALLNHIQRYASLQQPSRSDGNNFGAEVLGDVLSIVRDKNDMLISYIQELPGYHLTRHQALEKAMTSKTNVVLSKSTSTTTEESKPVEKKTELQTSEDKSEEKRSTEDLRRFIVLTDAKWYWTARDAMRQIQDAYLAVVDAFEKNRQKVDEPRGKSTHHNMY